MSNIKSKLEKLEKKMSINSIPQSVFAKVGCYPYVIIDDEISENTINKKIEDTEAAYFDKLAKELNTTSGQARELYKKSGLNQECMVISIVH